MADDEADLSIRDMLADVGDARFQRRSVACFDALLACAADLERRFGTAALDMALFSAYLAFAARHGKLTDMTGRSAR